jgi:hypothetical protein
LHLPEDATSQYVTHVVIQDTGGEFFLTFFKAEPPILAGVLEQQEPLQEAESSKIQAEYLGRFVFSETRLNELIDILSNTLQKHLALKNLKQGEEEQSNGC